MFHGIMTTYQCVESITSDKGYSIRQDRSPNRVRRVESATWISTWLGVLDKESGIQLYHIRGIVELA